MSKTEHRVRVDGGKYTFVVPADDYRISILRYGEPWHGPQSEASNALHAIMCELDAARVVVEVARHIVDRLGVPALRVAIKIHDSLVEDREKPSEWANPSVYTLGGATTDSAPVKCTCAGAYTGIHDKNCPMAQP